MTKTGEHAEAADRPWAPATDARAVPDFVAVLAALLFALAAGVALTQSDGDLFAHLRLGQIVLDEGAVPRASPFDYAATPATYPAWLAAVFFARLEALGGLAMIVAFTSVVAGLTHGLLTDLLRRRASVSPARLLVAALVAFLLASAHWLARPHLFSMLLAVLLLLLLESEARWTPLAALPLFALWANLHGAWAYGLIVAGAYVAGDLLEWRWGRDAAFWRRRVATHALFLALAAAGTVANPYGLALHRLVLATLVDPAVASVIDEYQPPGFSSPVDLAFFALLVFSCVAVWRSGRRLPWPWLLVALGTALMSLRAGRNIAFFGLVAWPLVVLHLAGVSPGRAADSKPAVPGRRFGWLAGPVFVLLLAIGAAHGKILGAPLIPNAVDATRFPVAAVDRLRAEPPGGRLLTTWTWSGYVVRAWPGERVFFDPLVFTSGTLDAFGRMLLTRPGWREELTRQQIRTALLPLHLPLADSLAKESAWRRRYADAQAIVFARTEAPSP